MIKQRRQPQHIAYSDPLDSQPQGAYVQLEDLIKARFAAHYLHLNQRRPALNQLVGMYKSNFRHRGIDFEEVRPYYAGDAMQSIDWRTTARLGKPYTKLFREERERPLLIVCDQRQSMYFGSQHCFKSVLASTLSAWIAWSSLQQSDRVGGLIIGNTTTQRIRPQRGHQSVLHYLQQVAHYNQQLSQDSDLQQATQQTWGQALTELRRISRPGSAIFLISDFNDWQDDTSAQKQVYLLAQSCEITAFFTHDPLEKHCPPPGYYSISNGQQSIHMNTTASKLRNAYTQHFVDREKQLRDYFAPLGIPLITISTEDKPLRTLLYYYGRRHTRVTNKRKAKQ